MPWQSEAQRRWGHSTSGEKELGAAKVAEFDQATKGKRLVEKVKPKTNTKTGKR